MTQLTDVDLIQWLSFGIKPTGYEVRLVEGQEELIRYHQGKTLVIATRKKQTLKRKKK